MTCFGAFRKLGGAGAVRGTPGEEVVQVGLEGFRLLEVESRCPESGIEGAVEHHVAHGVGELLCVEGSKEGPVGEAQIVELALSERRP
jgi:hypothetical protein